MRLYLLGLLSGLLVSAVVGVVACGPTVGPGDGGNGGDIGVSVKSLKVQEVTVDCSNPETIEGVLKGVPIQGVDFDKVVSVSGKATTKSGLTGFGSRGLWQSNGKLYASCSSGEQSYVMFVVVR